MIILSSLSQLMKNTRIFIVLFALVYIFSSTTQAGFFDFLNTEIRESQTTKQTETEVRKQYILTKSNLQKNVKWWDSYINRLDTVLETIEWDALKISKVLVKIDEIKEKQKNLSDSDERNILLNYIYYRILTVEYESQRLATSWDVPAVKSVQVSKPIAVTQPVQINQPNIEQISEPKTTTVVKKDDYKGKTLEDFPVPSKKWQDEFNLVAPSSWFAAILFDTETWEQNNEFITDSISISESWSVWNISSVNDLGAYFIWNIDIPTSWEYEFITSQSWAQTRIILDNKLISWQSNSSSTKLYLDKWEYTMEVEFINNWHTVDLFVSYGVSVKDHSYDEVKEIVQTQKGEVWYVGVYETVWDWHELTLNIPKTSESISLVLTSYGVVNWKIKNSNAVNIRDVVFSSYEPGSTVSWVSDTTVVTKLKDREYDTIPNIYQTKPECDNFGGHFHCEYDIDAFQKLNAKIKELFWKELTGFAGDYEEEVITLPWKILDNAEYEKIEEEYQEILDIKKQSEEKKDFNNMFD